MSGSISTVSPRSTAAHRGIMIRRHPWFPSGSWTGSEWQRPSKAQVKPQKLLKGWGLSLVPFFVPFTIQSHRSLRFDQESPGLLNGRM